MASLANQGTLRKAQNNGLRGTRSADQLQHHAQGRTDARTSISVALASKAGKLATVPNHVPDEWQLFSALFPIRFWIPIQAQRKDRPPLKFQPVSFAEDSRCPTPRLPLRSTGSSFYTPTACRKHCSCSICPLCCEKSSCGANPLSNSSITSNAL